MSLIGLSLSPYIAPTDGGGLLRATLKAYWINQEDAVREREWAVMNGVQSWDGQIEKSAGCWEIDERIETEAIAVINHEIYRVSRRFLWFLNSTSYYIVL